MYWRLNDLVARDVVCRREQIVAAFDNCGYAGGNDHASGRKAGFNRRACGVVAGVEATDHLIFLHRVAQHKVRFEKATDRCIDLAAAGLVAEGDETRLREVPVGRVRRQYAQVGLWCKDLRISISGSASVFESLSCLSSSTHRVATISPVPSTGS